MSEATGQPLDAQVNSVGRCHCLKPASGKRIRTVSEATGQPLDGQVNSVAALAFLMRQAMATRSLRSPF